MKKIGEVLLVVIGSVFIIPSAIAGFTIGMLLMGFDLGYKSFK